MEHRIEERFAVRAPVEAVWAHLVDPQQVVTCLPGAELTEVVDPRTYRGNVKVKIGPVTIAYQGRVQLAELDERARRVKMVGEGRESGGTGSAKMTVESRMTALPGGGTEVVVQAEVEVAGRLVQLGRGMVEQVAHQLFLEFAQRLRRVLEPGPAAGPAGAAARSPEPLRAIRLFLRALRASIAAFFRRRFGGRGG